MYRRICEAWAMFRFPLVAETPDNPPELTKTMYRQIYGRSTSLPFPWSTCLYSTGTVILRPS
jgi:hypothetical protein